MQPTREMQAMAAAGQISLDDLRAAAGAAGGVHDDFLDQMLGSLPPSAWPELASAAGGKAPDGGGQAEGMQHQAQHFGGGLYDESALLASRLRQHQISGGPAGGGAEAAKQMVLQQLAADLRQGHHMLLQGMGRSTGGGGSGDGGLHLPLSLGGGGSGSDVQALLKAAANSAVLIHHLLCSNPLSAFFPVKNLESFCKKKVRVFIRCSLQGGEAAGVFGGSFAGSLQQQQQRFQSHPQVSQDQQTSCCVHGLMLVAHMRPPV
jgi:hypothetical protein